jgi:lipid-binding SYLF domain-containing protein
MHRRSIVAFLTLAAAIGPITASAASAQSREAETLAKAREALEEMLATEELRIPEPLLEDCECIAVFPGVIKGAVAWGARHGRGVMSCRDSLGAWGPPTFMTLTGGSFGLQLGVEKSDVALFVMNAKGARSLLSSEFTLGAKGGVAAGPVGRSAEGSTDVKLDAEIYSYAISKGLFAGLSLEGARVNADRKGNKRFYGRDPNPIDLVRESTASDLPAAAREFAQSLPVKGAAAAGR